MLHQIFPKLGYRSFRYRLAEKDPFLNLSSDVKPENFGFWYNNRSLDQINKDILAVPRPIVESFTLDAQKPFDLPYSQVAVLKIRKWDYFDRDDTAPKNQIKVCGHLSCDPNGFGIFSNRKLLVDKSSKFIFRPADGPKLSWIDVRETQNDDGYMVGYGGQAPIEGRHFEVVLHLSEQMMEKVQEYLPERDSSEREYGAQQVVFVPMDHDLPARQIDLDSPEPFVPRRQLPCPLLLIAHLRAVGPDFEVTGAYGLRETV